MFNTNFRINHRVRSAHSTVALVALVSSNLLFNIVANSSFQLSADSLTWRGFLVWQIVGNLAGLITVLTFTWLLRLIPLHVAYPLTTGLSVIGVQVVAARWLFGDTISSTQWLGTLLVVAGISLIGGG